MTGWLLIMKNYVLLVYSAAPTTLCLKKTAPFYLQ